MDAHDRPDALRPVLLTEAELVSLRSLLGGVSMVESGFSADARRLRDAIADREPSGPHYAYVLQGPWGTIKEGDGSLEATIAGCRDARAQHWASGQPRDERYAQIQVLRYPSYYFEVGNDEAEFRGAEEIVEVPDMALTDAEQAESDQRVIRNKDRQAALYAHLRDALPASQR